MMEKCSIGGAKNPDTADPFTGVIQEGWCAEGGGGKCFDKAHACKMHSHGNHTARAPPKSQSPSGYHHLGKRCMPFPMSPPRPLIRVALLLTSHTPVATPCLLTNHPGRVATSDCGLQIYLHIHKHASRLSELSCGERPITFAAAVAAPSFLSRPVLLDHAGERVCSLGHDLSAAGLLAPQC